MGAKKGARACMGRMPWGGAYKCGPHGPFSLVVSFVAGLGREGGGGGWRVAGGGRLAGRSWFQRLRSGRWLLLAD